MAAKMIAAGFVSLVLSLLPSDEALADDTGLIELNHYYDDQGKPIFSQFIFWDWNSKIGTHVVRAWTMAETRKDANGLVCRGNTPVISNRPRPVAGGWELRYVDRTDSNPHRRITGRAFRETWTQFDPELLDRKIVPKEERKALSLPPKAIKKPANGG